MRKGELPCAERWSWWLAPQPAAARIKLRLRPAQADPFEGRGAASPRARNEHPTVARPRSPVAANAAAERARAALAAESAARRDAGSWRPRGRLPTTARSKPLPVPQGGTGPTALKRA